MFNSKKLSSFSEISHGFFNRTGGVSVGIYKSLNCGIGSKDKKINIEKNLKIVKSRFNKKSKKIFLVQQMHSSKFVFLSKNAKIKSRSIRADAIITEKKKFPIAVLTADCVPILLFDKKRKMIAAIHAGWRGALKGIVSRVIKFMLKKGCNEKDIIVTIGPSITQKNYNVKINFKKKFLKKHKKNKIFFKNINNLIYFDLPNYIRSQLKFCKISKIDMINIDTYDKKNNFFSARRSLKLKHDDYGRNISIIMIN